MRIIDVDSHFNEPHDWFEKANPTLAAQLPRMTVADTLLDVVVGDLFASVPPALRPDPMSLLPREVVDAYDHFLAGGDPPQVAIDAGAFNPEAWQPEPRIAWMDCSNPSHSPTMARAVRASCWPASVKCNWRPMMSYRGMPTDSAISRSCIEAVGCVTCMARAAALTLPVSAVARNRRS